MCTCALEWCNCRSVHEWSSALQWLYCCCCCWWWCHALILAVISSSSPSPESPHCIMTSSVCQHQWHQCVDWHAQLLVCDTHTLLLSGRKCVPGAHLFLWCLGLWSSWIRHRPSDVLEEHSAALSQLTLLCSSRVCVSWEINPWSQLFYIYASRNSIFSTINLRYLMYFWIN